MMLNRESGPIAARDSLLYAMTPAFAATGAKPACRMPVNYAPNDIVSEYPNSPVERPSFQPL